MKCAVNREQLIRSIEANQKKLYFLAYKHVGNEQDALDITHNAIVKAMQKYSSLREARYLETWLCRIVINESLALLKKRKRDLPFEEIEVQEDQGADGQREEKMDLRNAIDHLPEELKTIIILRFYEEFKIEEIAEITDTKLSTTKTRLYKALNMIKRDLEGYDVG